MSAFLSRVKAPENSDFMYLVLSFPAVDPLHEYVTYGYIAWMSRWICNKPNSSHPYCWSTAFLISPSNTVTGLFRFETFTLMFCQYWERKSWPCTQEVKGMATMGPLLWDQCIVMPRHVGYLDITELQSLNLKHTFHVNINSIPFLLFPQSLPVTRLSTILLSICLCSSESYSSIIWKSSAFIISALVFTLL